MNADNDSDGMELTTGASECSVLMDQNFHPSLPLASLGTSDRGSL